MPSDSGGDASIREAEKRTAGPLRDICCYSFFGLSDIEFGLFELRARDFETAAVRADDLNGLLRFVEKAPVGFRSVARAKCMRRVLLEIVHM